MNNDFSRLISGGITGSIIGQYISDLLFNIFVFNRQNLFDIITNISPTPAYIAATASGFLNGLTSPYIDNISSIAFRNVAYVYVNNVSSKFLNEEDIIDDIDVSELIQDTIAIVILIWVFSRSMRNNFYNHKLKMYGYEEVFDDDLNAFDSVLAIVVINLYAYYKYRQDDNNELDTSFDVV